MGLLGTSMRRLAKRAFNKKVYELTLKSMEGERITDAEIQYLRTKKDEIEPMCKTKVFLERAEANIDDLEKLKNSPDRTVQEGILKRVFRD